VGLAALGAATGYTVALFASGPLLPRLLFGAAVIVVLIGASFVMPLPTWGEPTDRRLTARSLMVGEALMISAVATTIALAMR
jgi:hypothetical protein